MNKIKKDEERDGKNDRWSPSDDSHESKEDDDDDEQDENGEAETKHDKDHNQRFHAAFHDKKISRFNQRRHHTVPDVPQNTNGIADTPTTTTHVVPDAPQTTHDAHNEL